MTKKLRIIRYKGTGKANCAICLKRIQFGEKGICIGKRIIFYSPRGLKYHINCYNITYDVKVESARKVRNRDAELLKKHKEIINCVEQIKADIRNYLVKTRDEPLFYEELIGEDGQVKFGLNKIKKLLSNRSAERLAVGDTPTSPPKPEEKKIFIKVERGCGMGCGLINGSRCSCQNKIEKKGEIK